MPIHAESVRLMIVLVSILLVFSALTIVYLFVVFNKKGLLAAREKELMRGAYEKSILQSQLEIQEQTFSMIASELHDNIGQVLSLARVQINIMNERGGYSSEIVNEVKENIGKAMNDLRDIARGLSSDRIRMMGICESVEDELSRISKTGIMRTSLSRYGQECVIDDQKKLILFRIVQESIHNCIKHSGASELSVRIDFEQAALRVCIGDNGRGFDLSDIAGRTKGMGLSNMKRRAGLAGGELQIESADQMGTLVQVKIPYR